MLSVKNLKKVYGDLVVLDGVNLGIESNKTTTIIGPSGSGKSTLLRCMNLLEIPTDGKIEFGGIELDFGGGKVKNSAMIQMRKKTGMVFQQFNLFPHKTVLENIIEAPVHVLKREKKEVCEEAEELLKKVGLLDKKDTYPAQLSGGQQQRIAIARAMAMHPEILLFDEPKPGQRVLMLGSGNVGLIVSYQLMQAGCDVVALVDAAPKIGGYAVHAAKIRRAGVPILLKHTIKKVEKDENGCVCAAIIMEVDDKFQFVPGTEQRCECDAVALAVGLKPLTDLVKLADCKLTYNGAFGGWIPLHNSKMETSCEGIYVAGDATGVEEANTALEEGKIAGISAAQSLNLIPEKIADDMIKQVWERLEALRTGPFGERRKQEKEHVIEEYRSMMLGERKSSLYS